MLVLILMQMININFNHFFLRSHCTTEELDKELTMEVDNDEQYDNKSLSQASSKRMKRSQD
jgi:hypothetical protein